MVDLSKHLERAKQAIERRNYDLAIEITTECQEVDPTNVDNYALLIDAAKRRFQEGGKKGLGIGLSLSKDPHKQLSSAIKKVAKNPDLKALMAAGDAARGVFDSGVKGMADVGILFYEEGKKTGLFNKELLWNLAHLHYAKFQDSKVKESLERALNVMEELAKGDSSHPEAARTMKNWEAMRSMVRRQEGVDSGTGDYRGQLADDSQARRNEVMNRIIRSKSDADEVLALLAEDVQERPDDKSLWLKKGDVHRRISQFAEARAAYQKAQEIDPHDFVITTRMGDNDLAELRAKVEASKKAGQDSSQLQAQYLAAQVEEYRKRAERQPTEMSHHYHLASCLWEQGDVDGAAAEFQQAKRDPRFRRKASSFLGHCFAKKNLLDLAKKQFTECLSLIEDTLSDESKETLYNRGRVSEAKGDTDDAMADYTKVVEMDLGYRDAAERLNRLNDSGDS